MSLTGLERCRANLKALRALQPTVASVVEVVPIPNGVYEAVGRDETPTFQLTDEAGRRTWFGQSSMPSVSAAEMFCNLRGDGDNVSLPGILTGMEPLVIAERLPRHSAVFVVEENPLYLKLAMHLYDYSALFSSGRLVFVLGDDFGFRLVEFFEAHPGYTLPTQMFTVPQRSPAQIAELQRRFEQAGESVLAIQARIAESCAESIRRRRQGPFPKNPRVALLSTDPSDSALEQAQRIRRAMDSLGWAYETCVPDSPGKCHIAARMQTVERAAADLVLSLNGFPSPLRALLPTELPIAAWYAPGVDGAPPIPSAVGPHDVIVASSNSQYDSFVSSGLARDAVMLCEPGADVRTDHPLTRRAVEQAPIAVLLDLPDDRPETCGINLPSHVALWGALQEATRQRVDCYADEIAEDILQAAEASSGTVLHEPVSRRQFLHAIRTMIAPAAVGRSTVESLRSAGHEVEIWGSNWSVTEVGNDQHRGPIPHGELLNQIFIQAGAVVIPTELPTSVQLALDALAAGATVILRSSEQSMLKEYPGLVSVARFLTFYRTASELTGIVSQGRDWAKGGQSQAAVTEIHANHSQARRLLAIAHRLR